MAIETLSDHRMVNSSTPDHLSAGGCKNKDLGFAVDGLPEPQKLAFGLLTRFICQARQRSNREPFYLWRDIYTAFTNSVVPALEKRLSDGCHSPHTKIDMFKVVCLYLDKQIFDSEQEGLKRSKDIADWNDVGHVDRMHKKRKIVDSDGEENGEISRVQEIPSLGLSDSSVHPQKLDEPSSLLPDSELILRANSHREGPTGGRITKDLLLRLASSSISRIEEWASSAGMPTKMEMIPFDATYSVSSSGAGSRHLSEDYDDSTHNSIRDKVSTHLELIQKFLSAMCLAPLKKLGENEMRRTRNDTFLLLGNARRKGGNSLEETSTLVDAWLSATRDIRNRQRRIVDHLLPNGKRISSTQANESKDSIPTHSREHVPLKQVLSLPVDASDTQVEVWHAFYSALVDPQVFNEELSDCVHLARKRLAEAHSDWRHTKQEKIAKKLRQRVEEKARKDEAEAERLQQIALRRPPIQYILDMERRRSNFDKENRDNPFFILGIPTRIATKEMVKKVSKTLYLLTHPDKCTDPELKESASAAFKLVTEATPLALKKLETNEHIYLFAPPLCPPFAAKCGIPPHLFSSHFLPTPYSDTANVPPDPTGQHCHTWIPSARASEGRDWKQPEQFTPDQARRFAAAAQEGGRSWYGSQQMDTNLFPNEPRLYCTRIPQWNKSEFKWDYHPILSGEAPLDLQWEYQPGLPLPTVRQCEIRYCDEPADGDKVVLPHLCLEAVTQPPYGLAIYVSRPHNPRWDRQLSTTDCPTPESLVAVYTCKGSALRANLSHLLVLGKTREVPVSGCYIGIQTIDSCTRRGSQIVWRIVDLKQQTKSALNQLSKDMLRDLLSRYITADSRDSKVVQEILHWRGTGSKTDVVEAVTQLSATFWREGT